MRRLGLTTDSGLNEATVDSMLESLSSTTNFTSQLLVNADTCIEAMGTTLTADQQGVYILACLKLRFKADCASGNDDKTLCPNAEDCVTSKAERLARCYPNPDSTGGSDDPAA